MNDRRVMLGGRSERRRLRVVLHRVGEGLGQQDEHERDEHDQLDRSDEARHERRSPPGADQGLGWDRRIHRRDPIRPPRGVSFS